MAQRQRHCIVRPLNENPFKIKADDFVVVGVYLQEIWLYTSSFWHYDYIMAVQKNRRVTNELGVCKIVYCHEVNLRRL